MSNPLSEYQLVVQIGSSHTDLAIASVNRANEPTKIENEFFSGQVLVRVKDFENTDSNSHEVNDDSYFADTRDTSSVQFRGTIKLDVNGDELLFGNDFDQSIRDSLPSGTSLGLRALKWIDPSLETDLYSDKPWAFSPLIATMNLLNTASQPAADTSPFTRISEDTSNLVGEHINVKQRRAHFSSREARQRCKLHNAYIEGDFSNPFIDFNTLSIALPYTNLHIKILQYWKGIFLQVSC